MGKTDGDTRKASKWPPYTSLLHGCWACPGIVLRTLKYIDSKGLGTLPTQTKYTVPRSSNGIMVEEEMLFQLLSRKEAETLKVTELLNNLYHIYPFM